MEETLRHTPLHGTHERLGAKMVPFGGWHMPIQYSGILAEHAAVRAAVGVFDVSHMGEIDFLGSGALAAVQSVVTNDASRLADARAQYTVTCHAHGGIVDDCIVYRLGPEHFRIVVNASNIEKDFEHFRRHAGQIEACRIENRSDDFALLAVQGPKAVDLVAGLAGAPLREVPSFGLGNGTVAGVDVLAARTGYTGEDGFELFVPAAEAVAVWEALTGAGATPIGLGARDTLRLEARLPLYGNDIDDATNPYEAGLQWVVKLDKASDFVGRDALRTVAAAGPGRKLVGFTMRSRGIVRGGAEVLGEGDAVIGRVTSGGPAPTVGGAIGLAYVPTAMADPGAPLRLRQRGKVLEAVQVKGPFYRRKS
jgi:aminomethyltransferase